MEKENALYWKEQAEYWKKRALLAEEVLESDGPAVCTGVAEAWSGAFWKPRKSTIPSSMDVVSGD